MDIQTVIMLVAAIAVPVLTILGNMMTIGRQFQDISTRQKHTEGDVKVLHTRVDKRDDEIDCLDKKVDDIRIELGKIETKLDILVAERSERSESRKSG